MPLFVRKENIAWTYRSFFGKTEKWPLLFPEVWTLPI